LQSMVVVEEAYGGAYRALGKLHAKLLIVERPHLILSCKEKAPA
jgi:hypothetical protein